MTKRSESYRRTCARCRRPNLICIVRLNDGTVCSSCRSEAFRTHGACDQCGREGLVPSRGEHAAKLCPNCAPIQQAYICKRCGKEWMLAKGLCEWCQLQDRLDDLLEGPVDLSALKALLLRAARPDSILIWLRSDQVRVLLSGFATASRPLSHAAIDDYGKPKTGNHIRGLLVDSGLLEPRNENLARFAAWVRTSFPDTPTIADDLLLRRFVQWRQQPALRHPDIGRTAHLARRQETRVAAAFLNHLHQKGESVSNMTQATVDHWWATPPTTARRARRFLSWCIETKQTPSAIRVPRTRPKQAEKLSQQSRLDLLARTLDPTAGPLNARTAGIMLLLLAQPFPRIAGMRKADVDLTGPTTLLIARDPIEIPEPFAAVIREQVHALDGQRTAANPDSEWLFVGMFPGQHITLPALRAAVRSLGVDLRAAKASAIETLVMDCPPAIVADMLGYSYSTIDRHATMAGASWAAYAHLASGLADRNPRT